MPDLTILNVSAPSAVIHDTPFSLSVDVTATSETFEDGAAYRLFALVCTCQGGPLANTPITIRGHLGDYPPGWSSRNFTFNIPLQAGSSPDVYNITVVLLEGASGIDPDSGPSFGFAGPIVVV